MRLVLSLVLAVAFSASAEAGGCFGKKASRCCSVPCGPCVTPCAVPCEPAGTWEVVKRTVCVPETVCEKRIIDVCVPEWIEKSGTRKVCKTICEEVDHKYTVLVPTCEERDGVKIVCKPVWVEKEVPCTVMVAHEEERSGTRHVCHVVPVVKMRKVCEDKGHWEERVVEHCGVSWKSCGKKKYCATSCGPVCGGCTTTTVCKVWVPNLVETEVEYTCHETQVVAEPYTYKVTVCKPEQQMKKVRVCEYVKEEVPYKYHVTVCKEEERVCKVKVCRNEWVEEPYTWKECAWKHEKKEVDVHVCKMVQKEIECKVWHPAPCHTGTACATCK
jgi:hypothetical protein